MREGLLASAICPVPFEQSLVTSPAHSRISLCVCARLLCALATFETARSAGPQDAFELYAAASDGSSRLCRPLSPVR
eukprot:3829967-Pleurochrysis_carterae.AAC.5